MYALRGVSREFQILAVWRIADRWRCEERQAARAAVHSDSRLDERPEDELGRIAREALASLEDRGAGVVVGTADPVAAGAPAGDDPRERVRLARDAGAVAVTRSPEFYRT